MDHEPAWETRLTSKGFSPWPNGLWCDDTGEIGAAVTDAGVFVGWIDVGWSGPATPFPMLKAVSHVAALDYQAAMDKALKKAIRARKRAVITCIHCKRDFVPGHMHGNVCHGCAETHWGIVH